MIRQARRALSPFSVIRKPTAFLFAMGLPMFFQQFLHRRHVQNLICHDPLELGVLGLELPQPLGVRCFHPAELLPPRIERRRADPVAPADVVDLRSGLAFLQDADDLSFGEPLPFHESSSFIQSKVENSSSQWPAYRGEGQPPVTLDVAARRGCSTAALLAGLQVIAGCAQIS